MSYGNQTPGFWDDEDPNERRTQLPSQSPYAPPGASGYDVAESPTILPGGSGVGGVPRAVPPQADTILPGGGNGMGIEDRTMMDPGRVEVKPIGFLIVKRPLVNRGTIHRVAREQTVIGRKDAHITIGADMRISSRHASIRISTDSKTGEPVFVLSDLDSENGTFLNKTKTRITRKTLQQGDEIHIGEHTFVFVMLKD